MTTVETDFALLVPHGCAKISSFWPTCAGESVPATTAECPYDTIAGFADMFTTAAGTAFTVTVTFLFLFRGSTEVNLPAWTYVYATPSPGLRTADVNGHFAQTT